MPSTTLQLRISAFESLNGTSTSSSTSPPRNGLKQAVKPSPATNSLLETPLSPTTAASLPPVVPFTPPRKSISRSPSPSPPNLGRKTSLIDLKDWVVDDGPSPTHSNGFQANGNGHRNGHTDYSQTPTQGLFNSQQHRTRPNAPLINLESPPKPKPKPKPKALSSNKASDAKAPPLPPRKPSYTSLKSIASSSSSSTPPPSNGGTFLYPPRRADSLTVNQPHTYPPFKSDQDSRSRVSPGHAPASSISSFHSVSLSSDTDPSTPGSMSNFIATFPMDHDRESSFTSNGSEADSISLDESYENVSTSSLASPSTEKMITLDWEKAMAKRKAVPPKLPQRPTTASSARSSIQTVPPIRPPSINTGSLSTPTSPRIRPTLSQNSSSATLASMARRPPPPPPSGTSRSSDRSSIQSTATSYSMASSTNTGRTHSSLPHASKIKRPTPVPPAARLRFERVFNVIVVQRRKADKQKEREKPALLSPTEARRTRQAAGWRGLSVDLITGGDETPVMVNSEDGWPDDYVSEEVRNDERLEGYLVKAIWTRSCLGKERLKEIWNECDTNGIGSLDRDGFVRGMWRIDEELRRAQTHAMKSASTMSLGSLRMRHSPVLGAHKVPQRQRPILR